MKTTPFDSYKFGKLVSNANKLAKLNNFLYCRTNGIDGLTKLISRSREASNFFVSDDTSSGNYFESRNGGWYHKRIFTYFIIAAYDIQDLADRERSLNLCRQIAQQTVSYMLRQRAKYQQDGKYINLSNVATHEFDSIVMSHHTGMFVMFDLDEAVDMTFDTDKWNE